jgi:hypothetical protein
VTGSKLRNETLELLRSDDFGSVLERVRGASSRRMIRPLFSALYSADPLTKWRAVELLGVVVARLADEDMEISRDAMRRLMWSLNEDSGAIGWGAPEAMGEIMARHEGLAREFAHVLVSYMREDGNFLEYEPLQRGVMWGVGRLAQSRPELLRSMDASRWLLSYLDSPDSHVRGLAARALGLLGSESTPNRLAALMDDGGTVAVYEGGTLSSTDVGALARWSVDRLNRAGSRMETRKKA